MRKLLLFTLCCLCLQLYAEDTRVKSEIEAVTVYRQYARITRTATTKIPAGASEIIFDDLTSKVIGNSLQVQVKGNATLLSAKYQTNYLKDQSQSELITQLRDSLETLQYEIRWIQQQQQILTEEGQILQTNKVHGGEKEGLSVDDLKGWTSFYRERLMEIRQKQLILEQDQKKLQTTKTKINNQLSSISGGVSKPTGEIVLKFTSKQEMEIEVSCIYLATGAGWNPLYDMRSPGVGEPLKLTYKANVYQDTGHDWEQVNLTLSTSNPAQNNSRPILRPRYVEFYVAQVSYNNYKRQSAVDALSGRVSGVEVQSNVQMMQVESISNIATYDMRRDGNFNMYEEDGELDEPTPPTPPTDLEYDLNQEFEIEDPHDIPADGKEHIVIMETNEIETEYEYHTVPRLDKGAFLLAKVPDWGQYNLLPGKANIFFQDTYVGQSQINPNTTADTLLLSLGRDESIKVKRVTIKDLSETQFIGSNKKETLAYEILIRNNKAQDIEIEILDQIPISKTKDIDVKVLDVGGAEYVESYGKLSWKLKVPANQSTKVKFIYSLKYPKNQAVTGR